jgi:hypothetical protein
MAVNPIQTELIKRQLRITNVRDQHGFPVVFWWAKIHWEGREDVSKEPTLLEVVQIIESRWGEEKGELYFGIRSNGTGRNPERHSPGIDLICPIAEPTKEEIEDSERMNK